MLTPEQKQIFIDKVLSYDKYIVNYSFKLTKNRDESQELRAAIYYKLLNYMEKENCIWQEDLFETEKNFESWLGTVILNCFRSKYKKKIDYINKNYKIYNHTDIATEDNEEIYCGQTDDYGEFELKNNEILNNALRYLQDGKKKIYFQVFYLNTFEEKTYEEISIELGIPLGTVRSRLYRARNILAKKLNKYREQVKLL